MVRNLWVLFPKIFSFDHVIKVCLWGTVFNQKLVSISGCKLKVSFDAGLCNMQVAQKLVKVRKFVGIFKIFKWKSLVEPLPMCCLFWVWFCPGKTDTQTWLTLNHQTKKWQLRQKALACFWSFLGSLHTWKYPYLIIF